MIAPSTVSDIDVRMVEVGGQPLRVAIKPGSKARPPLLLFNGIGANWQLVRPFLECLTGTEAVIFDLPGIGGSPGGSYPYRPWVIALLGARLMRQLGYRKVDVAGLSWGGGPAQQFALQHSRFCRKLVLAATSAGMIMVPGDLSLLAKLVAPRRHLEQGYMRSIAGDLYGGAFRTDPTLIDRHAHAIRGATRAGYLHQFLALAGWSSLPWLWSLRQPTLVIMGEDDPLVPAVNGHILAHMIPRARLELIDEGHLFIATKPAETARLVEGFLMGE
jgi:poly(3-hydroxyalkanoate) depolymerase